MKLILCLIALLALFSTAAAVSTTDTLACETLCARQFGQCMPSCKTSQDYGTCVREKCWAARQVCIDACKPQKQ